jgi:hypothetical protein
LAANDSANLQANQNVTINVLANDTSAGGTLDTASIRITSAPVHGSASVTSGQVVYTPTAGYSGTDSFQYSVQDNLGAPSNAATVSIQVAAPPPSVGTGGGGGGGGGGGAMGALELVMFAAFILLRCWWPLRRSNARQRTTI